MAEIDNESLPYPADFERRLMKHGVHILGCGGGPMTEPMEALFALRWAYGEELLRSHCMGYLRTHVEATADSEVLCIKWRLVTAMLYHVGDLSTVDELMALRCVSQVSNRPSLDTLIGGLCHRLELDVPEGVEPVSGLVVWESFCYGPDPEQEKLWELLLTALALPFLFLGLVIASGVAVVLRR